MHKNSSEAIFTKNPFTEGFEAGSQRVWSSLQILDCFCRRCPRTQRLERRKGRAGLGLVGATAEVNWGAATRAGVQEETSVQDFRLLW